MKLLPTQFLGPILSLFLFFSCSNASPIADVQLNPETPLSTRQVFDRGVCRSQQDSSMCQLASLTNVYSGSISLYAYRNNCERVGYMPQTPGNHFDFVVNLPWIIVVDLYMGKYPEFKYGSGKYWLGNKACSRNEQNDLICRIDFRCN